MTLDDFKSEVEVLSAEESDVLRDLYIAEFIDTKKEHYQKYIGNKQLFSDGFCYRGYLWDCFTFTHHNKITFEQIFRELNDNQIVLVFWDIHSCENILIENYWKFPKERVIKIMASTLRQGLQYLPEDIYIFDYNFSWTYVLTHEDDGKRRVCMKVI